MAWPDEGRGDARLISSKLKACIPGNDASTTFLDVSGNSANLAVEANNTTAFDNEGFFKTTTGVTTPALAIPQAKIAWNPYRESMILSFMLNRSTPTVNEIILSIGGLLAGYQGFYLSHRSGSQLRIIPVINAGSSVAGTVDSTFLYSEPILETYSKTITLQAATIASVDGQMSIPKNAKILDIFADTTVAWTAATASLTVGNAVGGAQYATGFDVKTVTRGPTAAYTAAQLTAMDNVGANTTIHFRVASTTPNATGTTKVTVMMARPAKGVHITIAFDAPTGSWYLYKDGVLDPVSSSYVGFSTGAGAYSDVASLAELRVGGLPVANNDDAVSVLGYGLQFAKYEGALTTNIGLIAKRLADTPRQPISASEW